jgi:hypothetical protein
MRLVVVAHQNDSLGLLISAHKWLAPLEIFPVDVTLNPEQSNMPLDFVGALIQLDLITFVGEN